MHHAGEGDAVECDARLVRSGTTCPVAGRSLAERLWDETNDPRTGACGQRPQLGCPHGRVERAWPPSRQTWLREHPRDAVDLADLAMARHGSGDLAVALHTARKAHRLAPSDKNVGKRTRDVIKRVQGPRGAREAWRQVRVLRRLPRRMIVLGTNTCQSLSRNSWLLGTARRTSAMQRTEPSFL